MMTNKTKSFGESVKRLFTVSLPMSAMMLLSTPVTAFAGDAADSGSSAGSSSGVADFLSGKGVSGSGTNAFDQLNNTTKAAASSGMTLAITIGITAAGIALVIAGIKMMGSPKGREEAKTKIIAIAGAVLLIGGAVGLINMLFGVGNSAFGG